jgi:hypothetical protein
MIHHVSARQFSLTERELTKLVETAGRLYDEAGRCVQAGCWRAALVLIGSALEASVVATACCLEPELRERGLWPRNGDPTRWTLGQAIDLAAAAGWLPSQQTDRDSLGSLGGDVGDAVRFLNDVRKMAVHPGAHAREEITPDFSDIEHMRPTYEVFDGIAAAVFERLARAIDTELQSPL